MKVLFTGGGSAGHVTPNVALIEQLTIDGDDCLYVGARSGIERDIIAPLGVPFYGIASGKLRRYFSWQNFTDPFRIAWGIVQSLRIVLTERPDVVFSKGGFVAVPVVFAAWLCRVPVICHESDVTPGLANKLCFPFARRICLNFEETLRYVPGGKAAHTGTPIRADILNGQRDRALAFLKSEGMKPLLLVFGGSLGAERINQQLRSVLDQLLARFDVIHVTGKDHLDESLQDRAGYWQFEFLRAEFGDLLAAADIVLARAGANSVYELLAVRKPNLLIPLSAKASRGDQIENAQSMAAAGYSQVLTEEAMDDAALLGAIDDLWRNRDEARARLENFPLKDSVALITQTIRNLGAT